MNIEQQQLQTADKSLRPRLAEENYRVRAHVCRVPSAGALNICKWTIAAAHRQQQRAAIYFGIYFHLQVITNSIDTCCLFIVRIHCVCVRIGAFVRMMGSNVMAFFSVKRNNNQRHHKFNK